MSGGGGDNKIQETSEMQELARIAGERYDYYDQYFKPDETQFINQIQGELPGMMKEGLGMSATNTAQRFGEALPQVEGSMAQRTGGVDSGGFKLGLGQFYTDLAHSRGAGMTDTAQLVRDQHTTNLGNLVNMGRGQATEAIGGLSNVADASVKQSILDARASAAARNAMGQGIGTAVGMGMNYAMPKNNPTIYGDDQSATWNNGAAPSGMRGPR